MVRYNAGEVWYLNDAKIEAEARAIQDEHTEMNGKQSLIEKFVNTLLPEDWATRDLEQRLAFWADGFSDEQPQGAVSRKYVCAMEIWRELFGGSVRDYTPAQAREINSMLKRLPGWRPMSSIDCGPIYGKQRGFAKIL